MTFLDYNSLRIIELGPERHCEASEVEVFHIPIESTRKFRHKSVYAHDGAKMRWIEVRARNRHVKFRLDREHEVDHVHRRKAQFHKIFVRRDDSIGRADLEECVNDRFDALLGGTIGDVHH